jgi:hypothetical protein
MKQTDGDKFTQIFERAHAGFASALAVLGYTLDKYDFPPRILDKQGNDTRWRMDLDIEGNKVTIWVWQSSCCSAVGSKKYDTEIEMLARNNGWKLPGDKNW